MTQNKKDSLTYNQRKNNTAGYKCHIRRIIQCIIGIATAMTIRLWAYLFNMLWGVKTNLDIEINRNERCMAKNPQQVIF